MPLIANTLDRTLASIFYLAEILTKLFVVMYRWATLLEAHTNNCHSAPVLKGFSYTLSPVIFGSIVLIILSLTTDLNTEYYDQMKLGAYLVITVWMWLCQFLFISTYFDRISGLNKIIMFALNVGIYLGMDKFKKFFYLFFSGLQ